MTPSRIFLGLLLLCPLTAGAQQRIATVDMQKVFDGYYKTVQLTKELDKEKAQYTAVFEEMREDHKDQEESYRLLLESVEDPAISESESTRRSLEARKARELITKLEQDINSYQQATVVRLQETTNRDRARLVKEIQEVIRAISRAQGYALVLDSKAQGPNGTPLILYSDASIDLTQTVLGRLNEGRPEPSE